MRGTVAQRAVRRNTALRSRRLKVLTTPQIACMLIALIEFNQYNQLNQFNQMHATMKKPITTAIANQPTQMPTVFSLPISIDPETDVFTIKGGAGYGVAHVKKPDGRVLSMHVQANGAFQQMTTFDPSQLSVDQRRELEGNLYRKGMTQTEIAELVGKSQPTVANDLKILREKGEI